MKKKEFSNLKDKSIEELLKQLQEIKTDLAKIIINMNIGKIKNVSLVGEKRKDIARILTVLKLKELSKV